MGRVIAHPSDIGPAQLADCGSYDISEMYYAQSGKKFYINMPQKYFISMLTRYSLANLLLALVSYRYWFPFLTPMYWILYFKLNIFFSWCGVMNFSKKAVAAHDCRNYNIPDNMRFRALVSYKHLVLR